MSDDPARGRRHVLLDLDDTLYPCTPCEEAGLRAVLACAAPILGTSPRELEGPYMRARTAVKERIEGRGSSHSRLLYIAEMVQQLGRPDALVCVRTWERMYWRAFLDAAVLRPRVIPFFEGVRQRAGRIAIVSDLTLEVQLMKLEHLGILRFIDALVTSEEVKGDKPKRSIFRLAMDRLGTGADACIIVGDNEMKDGEGARKLGIPFFQIDERDSEGMGFDIALTAMSEGE